jgi:putative DNA primase/helicase
MQIDIREKARGRWPSILPALGIGAQFLTGKHGPCPCCGGRDRFRWDNREGTGSFFCSKCGSGSGFDLIMKTKRVSFVEAKKMVEAEIPGAPIVATKAAGRPNGRDFGAEAWNASLPLVEGYDPAAKYLARRGLVFPNGHPRELRFRAAAIYFEEGGTRSQHPALIARFAAPCGKAYTCHQTYLTADGEKAAVATVRKFAPGKVPEGGAVRLFATNGSDTLGIAEGLETALAAAQLFELPVWACLTAGNLQKWKAPAHIRNVIVCADNDESFTGQQAAFGLAARLKAEGLRVEVRLPDIVGHDWADMLDQPTREHVFA